MIIETTHNLNRKSYVIPLAVAEILLAFLLLFFPDTAKIFLFGLPIVLLFGEAIELVFKYLKRKKNIVYLIGAILSGAVGIFALFSGRKTFMLGIAILMLFETVRFFACSCKEKNNIIEKLIYICAALLSMFWMVLILFKGLHLYWSVREYLALYFIGSAILSLLRKR